MHDHPQRASILGGDAVNFGSLRTGMEHCEFSHAEAASEEHKKTAKSFLHQGRVRVLVRCRPLLPVVEESHTCDRIRISQSNNSVIVNDLGDENGCSGARQFRFDRVLSPSVGQGEIFHEVAPLVQHVLKGYHTTIFAYGQTGSGKTYTMEGLSYVSAPQHRRREKRSKGIPIPDFDTPPEHHGIMPRLIQALFDCAREIERKTQQQDTPTDAVSDKSVYFSFKCSYYQIYNETISDLLRSPLKQQHPVLFINNSSGKGGSSASTHPEELQVRWQRDNTFRVGNLFLYECDTADKMRKAFFSGVNEKVVSSHLMNQQSSRSHCVFTIYVECREVKTNQVIRRSEMSMVDLAGSERLAMMSHDPSATLFKESVNINTSLLALGKVITALASTGRVEEETATQTGVVTHSAGQRRKAHVPYRESKLTKLLKHALGGNSITIMIACISCSDRYVEESVSTMSFAVRARSIENIPRVNEDTTTVLIRQLRSEIAQLKTELRYYRALALKQLSSSPVPSDNLPLPRDPLLATPAPTAALAGKTSELDAPLNALHNKQSVKEGLRTDAIESQNDRLTSSLFDACTMLQHLIKLNGQLRAAYDSLSEIKDAGERREAELNMENLAMRERIEMLESIVLTKDFVDANAGIIGVFPGQVEALTRVEEEDIPLILSVDFQADIPSGDLADVYPPTLQDCLFSSRQGREKKGLGTFETHKVEPAVTALFHNANPRGVPFSAAETLGKQIIPNDIFKAEDGHERVEQQKKGNVSRDNTSYACSECVTLEKNKGLPQATKKAKRRKHALVRQLAEYDRRYRSPCYVQTYGDYYGSGIRASGTVSSISKRGAAQKILTDTAEVFNTTMRDENNQITKLLCKIPEEVAKTFIPESVQSSCRYGELTFCGEAQDIEPLQLRRKDREDRRAALLARQRELCMMVRRDIRERRFNTSEDIEAEPKGQTTSLRPYGIRGTRWEEGNGYKFQKGSSCGAAARDIASSIQENAKEQPPSVHARIDPAQSLYSTLQKKLQHRHHNGSSMNSLLKYLAKDEST